MLEVTIFSLLVGNFGWQAALVSGFWRWRQMMLSQRQQEEEIVIFESKEDSMTPNSNGKVKLHSPIPPSIDQQMVGWEYKIVRASSDLFRDPAVLQKVCQEEAKSGWILLEKLDDKRVRFKRLLALRNILDESELPHDPYRSHYGTQWTPLHIVGAIAAATAIVIPAYFTYSLVSTMLAAKNMPSSPTASPSGYENVPPQDFPPVKPQP